MIEAHGREFASRAELRRFEAQRKDVEATEWPDRESEEYEVTLSIPVWAWNPKDAVEVFRDVANEGDAWSYRVRDSDGKEHWIDHHGARNASAVNAPAWLVEAARAALDALESPPADDEVEDHAYHELVTQLRDALDVAGA